MATDKWVIVTGASSGIGKATALHLAEKGMCVLAGVRRDADGAALRRESDGRVTPILLDVRQRAHIEVCKELVQERTHGVGLKGLVNNAGINYISPFELTDEAKARHLFEVNFFGLCNLTQALIPELRQYAATHPDSSKIVNVGSIGSTIGIPWEPYYHASKFALLGLSESLMFELKRQNIKVSAILPGGVKTEFFDKTGQDIEAAIDSLDSEQKKLYLHGLNGLKRAFTQFEGMASDPRLVARVIARTIEARNPRFSQLVGLDANSIFFMVRFWPTALRQTILGPMFGGVR